MRLSLILTLGVSMAGCRPAARYGAVLTKTTKTEDKTQTVLHPHHTWLLPTRMPDLPIVFVPSTSEEWRSLQFWTRFPSPPAGLPTVHVGLPALQAAAALVLADHMQAVKIKVPLGLPDPTPHLPPDNPPTYGKWKLGRRIFFDKLLQGDSATLACATCHKPEHGFANDRPRDRRGERNALSLINVVYNKQQFWDGRVTALEEVVARALEDERPLEERKQPRASPESSHTWGGLVLKMAASPDYRREFKQVFGIDQPTQDSVARALATYVRTILAGDSVHDQAEQERVARKDTVLSAAHFVHALRQADPKTDAKSETNRERLAQELEKGLKLFHGSARCAACHTGPLFTDQDFHNTGWGNNTPFMANTLEDGRFGALPIGRKEARFLRAYRTPTLRNLLRTSPYFHDGAQATLDDVLNYYDHGIWPGPVLDPELKAGADTQGLKLEADGMAALAAFLRSLNGSGTDPILVPR